MIDFSHVEKYRENNRIEAKKALGGLPESIWETYSAFANTLGGIILLGVEEKRGGSFHAIDLPDPEWLIADFWDIINDKKRVSANILTESNVTVEETDGKRIVAIRIPRAPRKDRPIYIDGNPFRGTYRRSGEGDIRCSAEEVKAMMSESLSECAEKTSERKKAAVIFLTEYLFADRDELCALLCADGEEVDAMLSEMMRDGIVIKTVINGKIRYRLKA